MLSPLILLSTLLAVATGFHCLPPSDGRSYRLETTKLSANILNKDASSSPPLDGFRAAVVGAGPSGLLLAHRLLASGASHVEIYEGRKDPRMLSSGGGNIIEGRAYALGIGMRGRTAIRSVDPALWDAVKARGYESERFTLYINGFPIRLRDKATTTTTNDNKLLLEPSLLMYQSDLCAALLDELETRYTSSSGGRLTIQFEQKISSCDLDQKCLTLDGEGATRRGPFDLIIGCDGVNSAVRASMDRASSAFECEKNTLTGMFKVCRISTIPEKLDPTSVALILPKAGSTTAFVEPTANGTSCLLFAGNDADDPILNPPSSSSLSNLTATVEALEERFPILAGVDFFELARQLADQKASAASSVQCNIYHYGTAAVLCGDAAHATGGVSGQGVNSALMDAVVLGDCLDAHFDNAQNRNGSLEQALLEYSQRQVPEGKALYDLSFGPKPKGFLKIRFLVRNVLDTLFQGRLGIGQPPLQTLLTTSTKSFSEVRRNRAKFYDEAFPDQSTFNEIIEKLYDPK